MQDSFDLLFYLWQKFYTFLVINTQFMGRVTLGRLFIVLFIMRMIIVNLIAIPKSVPARTKFKRSQGGGNGGKSKEN